MQRALMPTCNLPCTSEKSFPNCDWNIRKLSKVMKPMWSSPLAKASPPGGFSLMCSQGF